MKRIPGLGLAAIISIWSCVSLGADEIKGKRAKLQGLVYEVEDWSTPKAWEENRSSPRTWNLWTAEQDVWTKRSMGASLQSPPITEDRDRPEDGAPPLHTHITGIPNGTYTVHLGNPSRTITLSVDGTNWQKFAPQGFEIVLGRTAVTDGTFDLWADDRYAHPGNPGSTYYDYIRFARAAALEFSGFAAHLLPNGDTQLSWMTPIPVSVEKLVYGNDGALDREVALDAVPLRNHRAVLGKLTPGQAYVARPVLRWLAGSRPADATFEFVAASRPTGRSQPVRIPLTVAEPTAVGRTSWPVRAGVPFARGTLWSCADCMLDGVAAQFDALAHWPDGSIKWLGLTFMADTVPDSPTTYEIVVAADVTSVESSITVSRQETLLQMSNGRIRIAIDSGDFGLFDRVFCDLNGDGQFADRERITGAAMGGNGRIVMPDGTWLTLGAPESVEVLEEGPVRAVVEVRGTFRNAGASSTFRYRVRYTLHAGDDVLYLDFTAANTAANEVVTQVRSLDLRLPILADGPVQGALGTRPLRSVEGDQVLSLLQDRDNHYALDLAGVRSAGERASGLAAVRSGKRSISVVVRDLWQTWPKGLAVKSDGLHLRLLPQLPADAYADQTHPLDIVRLYYWSKDGAYLFRSGMQTTAAVAVRFGERVADEALAQHVQHRLYAQAPSSVYCASGVFGRVDAAEPELFPAHERWLSEGFERLEETRRRNREYGWMNYGDWFGERTYNWGNSEYDLAWGAALTFARTGDRRWLWRGEQMARHYTDIDTLYRWDGRTCVPYRAYAHSVGHVGGFFERDDSRFSKSSYGRPHGLAFMRGAANLGGHCVNQGQIMMGLLMGEGDYIDAALGICDQIASVSTVNFRFGIERAAGWPLINIMAAYEATGNPYYLNAAKLMMAKVYELQDPDTGGWRMRQGPPECDCADAPHIGGKTFAVGILLRGLVMVDASAPDPEVKQCLVRACDWLMNHAWCEEAFGFRYKTGCAKFADRGGLGTSAALVAEGLAYASEITGDAKYRDFMLRWIGNVMQSSSSFGKTCSMLWRQTAYPLYFLKRRGLTRLPEPYTQPTLAAPKRALLDRSARGSFTLVVSAGSDASAPFDLHVAGASAGLTVTPARQRLELASGETASVDVTLAGAAEQQPTALTLELLRGEMRVGKRTVQILSRPAPERFSVGDRIGFAGRADNETLAALKAAGLTPEVLPPLATADLNGYRSIIVGRDTLKEQDLEIGSHLHRLADFATCGGRLVLFQLNDSDWEPEFLPGALTIVEPNGSSGKILKPEHSLFSTPHGIPLLAGFECYDTIVHAGSEWTVLAADTEGRPAILEASVGAGRVLVVEPNVDRAAVDDTLRPSGVAPAVPKQFMRNVVEYCRQ